MIDLILTDFCKRNKSLAKINKATITMEAKNFNLPLVNVSFFMFKKQLNYHLILGIK
jgi:hypothetical protein